MSACAMLKFAAELHDDEEMSLAVSGKDLMAEEFSKSKKKIACEEGSSTSFGDFDTLREFVQEHVIDGDQSVSIKLLTEVYGLNKEDTRVRSKVKKSVSSFVKDNRSFILKEAAKILRRDIMNMSDNAPIVRWPPAVEDLKAEERKLPQSLIKFLILLLHSTHHSAGDEVHRHSLSIAQDLVHAVS
eukprot:gene7272-12959_t